MKRFASTCLMFLGTIIITHAQMLKVTDVQSSEDKFYKSASEQCLGKSITLTIYDHSVSVQLPGEKAIIVKETADNKYSIVEEETDHEVTTADLVITKTLGVLTSAIVTITISEKVGQHRRASVAITAKRF